MKTPCNIENADGSPNAGGRLRYYTDLTVTTGGQSHPLRFYITDIGPDNLVLGYPWFKPTNITPDWTNGMIPGAITIHTLRPASEKSRRTTTTAPTRPMARILPNHPAFARLARADTQDHLAIDWHSSRCRFLLSRMLQYHAFCCLELTIYCLLLLTLYDICFKGHETRHRGPRVI